MERAFSWKTVHEMTFEPFSVHGLVIFWKLSLLTIGPFSSLTFEDTEEVSLWRHWVHKLNTTNSCMPGHPRSIQIMGGIAVVDTQFCSLCRLSQDFCTLKIMFVIHDICKSEAEAHLEGSMCNALSIPVYCIIIVQKGEVHQSPRFWNTYYCKNQIPFAIF